MLKKLALLFSAMLVAATGYGQNAVMVNKSNGIITYPNNFWTANALQGRTGLGLGSAATNASTAFQSSSSVLSNLASSNAVNLTNLRASNIIGVISSSTNVTGIVAITNGGTGATNSIIARTNLGLSLAALTNTNTSNFLTGIGLSLPALTNTNTENFRSSIGLGWSALTNTNASTSLLGYTTNNIVVYKGTGNLKFTNQIELTNTINFGGGYWAADGEIYTTNIIAAGAGVNGSLLGTIRIVDGTESNAFTFENSADAKFVRTNLGLGWSALTNTNAANFRTNAELGLPALTNTNVTNFRIDIGLGLSVLTNTNNANFRTNISLGWSALTNTNATNFCSAIGLGWSALTNTDTTGFNRSLYGSNTNPVLVSSNGSVVSPVDFWQKAPIQTIVETYTPTTNTNSYPTNARNLYVYSLTPSVSGVTNLVILPTDANTFDGDSATVTHNGTTNTVTEVSGDGGGTSLVAISSSSESVKFIREAGQWTFYHNISFTEPVKFADINIEENRAISRTNFGLGLHALTNTNNANFQAAVFSTNSTPNGSAFNSIVAWMEVHVFTNGSNTSFRVPLFK